MNVGEKIGKRVSTQKTVQLSAIIGIWIDEYLVESEW